jgi:hypothetical protein
MVPLLSSLEQAITNASARFSLFWCPLADLSASLVEVRDAAAAAASILHRSRAGAS